jgi:hypothetical protein
MTERDRFLDELIAHMRRPIRPRVSMIPVLLATAENAADLYRRRMGRWNRLAWVLCWIWVASIVVVGVDVAVQNAPWIYGHAAVAVGWFLLALLARSRADWNRRRWVHWRQVGRMARAAAMRQRPTWSLIEELAKYPPDGKHDDMIDAARYALLRKPAADPARHDERGTE